MSSVGSFYAQRPTKSFISYETYIQTLATMQSVFAGDLYAVGHQYTGAVPLYKDSIILFRSETDLGSAVQCLERYLSSISSYTDDYIPVTDLGKKLYLGVQGGDSAIFTYSLIKVTRGTGSGSNFYSLSDVGTLSSALETALTSHGYVWMARSG